MANYLIGSGHDVDLMALSSFTQEPSGEAVAPTERKYSLSGKVYDYGLFLVLRWDFFEEATDYYNMLEDLGLHNQDSAPVTIYCRTKRYTFARFNGIAQLPEPQTDTKLTNFFIRNVEMFITHMEQLTEL